jgi:chromosome segregation ATPase
VDEDIAPADETGEDQGPDDRIGMTRAELYRLSAIEFEHAGCEHLRTRDNAELIRQRDAYAANVEHWKGVADEYIRKAVDVAERSVANRKRAETAEAERNEARAEVVRLREDLEDYRGSGDALIATRQMAIQANAALRTQVLAALGEEDDGRTPLPDQLGRLCAEVERLRAEATVLDRAMHTVWLHINWRYVTSQMTTDEKEATWAAVKRYNAAIDADEPLTDANWVWWRDTEEATKP